ncbi:hypothetical protein Tco_0226731 [Tanacetum coccineum]
MDSENYKEGQYIQRPPLFEAYCLIYWKNRFETYVKSKDIDLWHITFYGNYKPTYKNKDTGKEDIIPYEKLEEASKNKKEKYKSLAQKAKKVSSDEEASCSNSNDEEYAMAVRDFKKFFSRIGKFVRQPHNDKKNFRRVKEEKKVREERRCFKCGDPKRFISDCPKHFNDQKTFVGGCWSDSEEEDDSKKEKFSLMALDNNKVLSNTLYYSSSSLDSESLQNEYNK